MFQYFYQIVLNLTTSVYGWVWNQTSINTNTLCDNYFQIMDCLIHRIAYLYIYIIGRKVYYIVVGTFYKWQFFCENIN